jgi:hypothetical protein
MDRNVFFKVGNQIFYSDISARKHAYATDQELTFHAYEQQYDSANWQQEPTGTWDWWCQQRALALKSRYQKLCLLFSAGSDSSDILRIFLENNIPIDELIIFRHFWNPSRKMEADTMIIPMAKMYQSLFPALNVKIIDIGQDVYEQWHGTPDWIEGRYTMSGQMNMGACIYSWLTNRFCNNNDNNTTGYIMGLEKPKLLIEDGWWTSRVIDRVFDYMDLNENNIEQFYFAPDMPEFFVKQCWELINYIESTFDNIDMSLMNSIYQQGGPLFHHYLTGTNRRIYQNLDSPMPIRNGSNKIQNLSDAGVQGLQVTAQLQKWKCFGLYKEIVTDLEKNHSYLFRDGLAHNGLVAAWSKEYKIKKVKSVL